MGNRIRIGCILLAAGRAERFGKNKLLELIGRKPMIEYVLSELCRLRKWGEVILDIRVVTIWDEVCRICAQYDIPCIRYAGGLQSDSIRIAVSQPEAENWDGCMFLTGDQPLLRAESMLRLIREYVTDPTKVYRLCCGEKQGNPVLFPAECIETMKTLTGDEGGRQLIRQKNLQVCCVGVMREEELMDVDTTEDLEIIRGLLH